jgi:hypothetical protein
MDRIVVGLHLRAQPQVRALAVAHGLSRSGGLVEFRLALASRPLARSAAEAVARYFTSGALDEELDYHLAQGMLRVDADGRLSATDAGRAFIDGVYDVHAAVAEESWAGVGPGVVADLATLAGRLLGAAAATGGPAFAGMSPPHERPGDPAELLVFNRCSALRYHRADAHAAAWAAAGHTAESINALVPGPERDAIEVETNRRAAPPYAALTADERLRLLAGLAVLSG